MQDLANLGEQYASELTVVNPGVLTLIRMAKDPELSAEDRAAVQELFRSILGAVAASRENVPVLAGFASSAEEIAKFSKKIRPLMKIMAKSVQRVVDAQTVLDEWERLIEEDGASDNSSS
ncbi:hypothetical protein ACFQ1B_16340 [Streptomyces mexicanus]